MRAVPTLPLSVLSLPHSLKLARPACDCLMGMEWSSAAWQNKRERAGCGRGGVCGRDSVLHGSGGLKCMRGGADPLRKSPLPCRPLSRPHDS